MGGHESIPAARRAALRAAAIAVALLALAAPAAAAVPLPAPATSLTVTADGRPWVVAGGALWRLRAAQGLWEAQPLAPAPAAEILGLRDGRLAIATGDALTLWDPATGTSVPVAAPAPLRALRLAPDGTVWALQGTPATIVHVDTATATATLHGVPADMADATTLAVARDGRVLLGTRMPSAVHVVDVAAGAIVCHLVPGGAEPATLAAGGDGRVRIALRARAGVATWDLAGGVTPPAPLAARLVAADMSGATWGAAGRRVVRLDRAARPVRLPEPARLLAASPRGGLWIAGRTTLSRVRG